MNLRTAKNEKKLKIFNFKTFISKFFYDVILYKAPYYGLRLDHIKQSFHVI